MLVLSITNIVILFTKFLNSGNKKICTSLVVIGLDVGQIVETQAGFDF